MVAIVNGLAKRCGAGSIHDLASAHQVVVGHMAAGTYRSSVSKSGSSALLLPDVSPDADPEGPLYGRVVVFTGSLMAMPRQDAMTLTAHVGGIPEKNTTKRTNVLVVGDLNPAVLRPGENLSGKARRAFELQDAGQEIEVMTEVDFLRAYRGVVRILGRSSPKRPPRRSLWRVSAEGHDGHSIWNVSPVRTTGPGSSGYWLTLWVERKAVNLATTAGRRSQLRQLGNNGTATFAAERATRVCGEGRISRQGARGPTTFEDTRTFTRRHRTS